MQPIGQIHPARPDSAGLTARRPNLCYVCKPVTRHTIGPVTVPVTRGVQPSLEPESHGPFLVAGLGPGSDVSQKRKKKSSGYGSVSSYDGVVGLSNVDSLSILQGVYRA